MWQIFKSHMELETTKMQPLPKLLVFFLKFVNAKTLLEEWMAGTFTSCYNVFVKYAEIGGFLFYNDFSVCLFFKQMIFWYFPMLNFIK